MFLLKTIKRNAKKNTKKADCLKNAEMNKRNNAEIKILPNKSKIFVIIYFECELSQNGRLLVCLQTQKNIFFVSSALYTTGLNSVLL